MLPKMLKSAGLIAQKEESEQNQNTNEPQALAKSANNGAYQTWLVKSWGVLTKWGVGVL
jgi:hypothetical protein